MMGKQTVELEGFCIKKIPHFKYLTETDKSYKRIKDKIWSSREALVQDYKKERERKKVPNMASEVFFQGLYEGENKGGPP